MANKILTIQLNADTKQAIAGINGVSDALNSMAGKTNFVLSLEKEREKINRKLEDTARAYAERVKKINEIQDESLRKQSLNALENSKGLARTNAELEKQLRLFKDIRAAQLGGLTVPRTEVAKATPTVSTETTPFSLGLSKSYEQLKADAEAYTRKLKEESIKQQSIEKEKLQGLQNILEMERAIRENARRQERAVRQKQIEDAFARQEARTTGFGNTITQAGIYRPASDNKLDMTRRLSAFTQAEEAKRLAEATRRQADADEAANKASQKRLEYFRNLQSSQRSLTESVIYSTVIYKAFTATLQGVEQALLGIPKAGIALESVQASLTATVGSAAGMGSVLEALDKEAQRTGIAIGTLRENFSLFQASTSLAGESLEATWKMFTEINTVSTALHLSTAKTISVFNALAQIFNKSKVQSEELVKQLGNLLPGAFASFAKANKDMFKSTQDLIAQMRQGAVFAHETVANFTEFLANRFGAAFAIASQGLNANLGRLQTAFTHLQETLYATSSGAINSVVKGLTHLLDKTGAYIAEGENLNKLIGTVAGSLGFLLYASLVDKIIPALKLATSSANNFKVSLLALGSNVVVATLAALGGRLYALGQAQEDLYKRGKELEENYKAAKVQADKAQPISIRVEADKEIRDAKKQIEAAYKELDAIRDAYNRGGTTRKTDEGLVPLEQARDKIVASIQVQEEMLKKAREAKTLEIKKADQEALNNIVTGGMNISEAIETMNVKALEAQGRNIEAAAADWDKTYKAKVDAAVEGIARAREQLTKVTDEDTRANLQDQIKSYEDFVKNAKIVREKALKDAEDKGKKPKPEENKAFRIDTQGVKADFTEYRQTVQEQLSEIEQLYTENGLSIEDYFARKAALVQKDIDLQKQANSAELELALKKGDTLQVEKLRENLAKINIAAGKEELKLTKEKTTAYQEYNQILMNIRAENAAIGGMAGQGALEQYYAKTFSDFQKLAREGNIEALNMLETNAQFYSLQQKIADVEKQRNNENTLYSNSLQRINVMKESGSISEFDAMRMITDKNNEHIRQLEEKLSLQKKIVADYTAEGRQVPPEIAASIDTYETQITELSSTADQFANYFRSTMTSAFSDSFAEFVKGTKTAEQAFSSFAMSIADALVKLAANQLATSLFNGISGSLAGTGIGNFFGIKPAANGEAVTGMGTSSGKVLTSPTLFPGAKVIPFARGGVLAGEAGAEAVLPLKRGKDGKLGVSTEEGSMGGNVYNIAVTVQGTKTDSPEQIGERVAVSMMRSIAREEIANSGRAGNALNKVNRVM